MGFALPCRQASASALVLRPLISTGFGILTLYASQVQGVGAVPPVQVPAEVDTSRQRLPSPPLPSESGVNFKLQATEKSAVPKEVEQVRFKIRDFSLEGGSVYELSELLGMFNGLRDTELTLAEVRKVTDEIEERYRRDGYFLTRVFIPPQSISAGNLSIRIIEGFVTDVDVSQIDPRLAEQVRQRMLAVTLEKPLRLQTMEAALLKLNDIPGIKAQGTLRPGRETGSSLLVMKTQESEGFQNVSLGNNASTLTGPWSIDYSAGIPDALQFLAFPHQLGFGVTGGGGQLEEIRVGNASVTFPVGFSDWLLTAGVLVARSAPGGSVEDLDLKSESESYSFRSRYPLIRSRSYSVYLDSGLTLNESRSLFSGLPISKDRTTVATAGLSLVNIEGQSLTTAQFQFNQGLDWFGAMGSGAELPSVSGFEPRFSKYIAQIQYNLNLAEGWGVSAQARGQHTEDKLLSGELLSFGGRGIGQGFLPSALTGDRGYGGKLEGSKAIPASLLEGISSARVYVYYDYARATTLGTAQVEGRTESFTSAGAGLRLFFLEGYNLDLLAGWPVSRPDNLRSGPRWLLTGSRSF